MDSRRPRTTCVARRSGCDDSVKLKLNNGCALGHIRFGRTLQWNYDDDGDGLGGCIPNYCRQDTHMEGARGGAAHFASPADAPAATVDDTLHSHRSLVELKLQIDIIAKYSQSDYFTPLLCSVIIIVYLLNHTSSRVMEKGRMLMHSGVVDEWMGGGKHKRGQ